MVVCGAIGTIWTLCARHGAVSTTQEPITDELAAAVAVDAVVRRTNIERKRLSTAVKRIGDLRYVSVWSDAVGEFFLVVVDDEGSVAEFNEGE